MYNFVEDYVDKVKILSSVYEVFVKQIMVFYVKGKFIDYVGIDSKIGCYLVVDLQILQLVFVLLVIFLDIKLD